MERRLSIAPMMDHSDRHFRYLMRLLSQHALLYTEMVTTGALIHGDRRRFLEFNETEHPLALQLGGSDPDELANCATIAEAEGYDEVNLNVGCPSDRAQSGYFGACLMAEAKRVTECIRAMSAVVAIPVSVKTRIGIDDSDDYAFLHQFIDIVSNAGCNTFIIHARKAILSGLSPKQNREIPPLNYQRVHQIKRAFPDLNITINGGFTSLDAIEQQYAHVNGVMIGRAAYQHPYLIAELEQALFQPDQPLPARKAIFQQYKSYIEQQVLRGIDVKSMSRHIIGLYQGRPGARKYRRMLSEAMPNDATFRLKRLDSIERYVSRYADTNTKLKV